MGAAEGSIMPLSEIGGLHAIIVGDSEQRSWYR
jgi:hypothetical protein